MVSYQASFFDPVEAKRELIRVLTLFSSADNSISERQIKSIKEVRLREGSVPSQYAGWRGFQRSTEVTLDLDSNLLREVFFFSDLSSGSS